MSYPDPFDAAQVDAVIDRIHRLGASTPPQWGKMSSAQAMAHLCVAYEMVYTNTHAKPSVFVRLLLRLVAKRGVVGPKPYPKNTVTAPQFRIADARDFFVERDRLIDYVRRVQADGREVFEGRESPSFGALTADEWAVLFGKHLDHHLRQFGV